MRSPDCPTGCNTYPPGLYQGTVPGSPTLTAADIVLNLGASVYETGGGIAIVPHATAIEDAAYCVNQVCDFYITTWPHVYFVYNSTSQHSIFSFDINDPDFAGYAIPPITMAFTVPAPSSTLEDFQQWEFSISNLIPGIAENIMIAYTDPASSITYYDNGYFTPTSTSGTFPVPKLNGFINGNSFNAHATLYYGFGTVQAEATTTFAIASTTPPFVPAASCNFTSSSFLGDPVGNIKQGVCAALLWAFLPNQGQQADIATHYNNIWAPISIRAPFGYATVIFAAFASFANGSNTSTLMSSTTYSHFSAILGPLNTGLSFLFWILLAFWIFHFARHIKI